MIVYRVWRVIGITLGDAARWFKELATREFGRIVLHSPSQTDDNL